MPITAKLSNKFYEKLGDDVANELVEWLNLVDTSYRQEFRELFEANFGRVDARLAAIERRMSDLEVKLEARMDAKLEALKSELLKWMFLFWVGTMGTVLAIVKL
jgi:hypothetical protein